MSQWCNKCHRVPYVGCDSSCPVFGKEYEDLANELLNGPQYSINVVNLLKERAGLKLHCAEYKRKYKALDRILHREIWYRIDGIKVQYPMIAGRLQRAETEKDRIEMQTILRCLSKEKENLQNIYDMCREVSK
jgi:hypothetical protein